MIPISFNSSFGWLHPGGGNCGIVLCSAQNFEGLCTHKGLRLMAEAFAKHGYPTLRFDYSGTGDSLGSDRDAERTKAWLASIEAAVAWMRANAEVEKIVLVGLRLGGALAALAAEHLGTISGLVLLAPVISGNDYICELTANSGLRRRSESKESKSPDLEIAGFVFTPETLKDITAINLASLCKAPAQDVLLIANASQTNAVNLAKKWNELGYQVQQEIFNNYSEFMTDAAFSQLPADVLQHMLDWLAAHFDIGSGKGTNLNLPYMPLKENHFIEYPVFFGGDRNLFGMMCIPKNAAYDRPVIVYLNGGANHHIGWGRATVDVCRMLAGVGFASLRIDVAAIGDSPDPDEKLEQIVYRDDTADVSAAIDWLETRGFRNVTVIGLCSGAYLGFQSAVADSRISRIVMINLQKFLWHKDDSLIVTYRESYKSTGFYLAQILEPHTWQRFTRGEIKVGGISMAVLGRLHKKMKAYVVSVANQFGRQTNHEIEQVKEWMRLLDRRKVQQCYVLSVGDAGLDELKLYMRVTGAGFKGSPFASVSFIENADHNLSQHAARDDLRDILQDIFCAEEARKMENGSRAEKRVA